MKNEIFNVADGEYPVVDAQVVHPPLKRPADIFVPDAQESGRLEVSCKVIFHYLNRDRLRIHVHFEPSCSAGAVVGDCQMMERAELCAGDCLTPGSNHNRVAGPTICQPEVNPETKR